MKLKLLIAISSGLLSACIVNADYGTTKQHHDIFKDLFGSLDDAIVMTGLMSDEQLHEIGASMDLCNKIPGETK